MASVTINGKEFDDYSIDLICTLLMIKRAEIKVSVENGILPAQFTADRLKDREILTDFIQAIDSGRWAKHIKAVEAENNPAPTLRLVKPEN